MIGHPILCSVDQPPSPTAGLLTHSPSAFPSSACLSVGGPPADASPERAGGSQLRHVVPPCHRCPGTEARQIAPAVCAGRPARWERLPACLGGQAGVIGWGGQVGGSECQAAGCSRECTKRHTPQTLVSDLPTVPASHHLPCFPSHAASCRLNAAIRPPSSQAAAMVLEGANIGGEQDRVLFRQRGRHLATELLSGGSGGSCCAAHALACAGSSPCPCSLGSGAAPAAKGERKQQRGSSEGAEEAPQPPKRLCSAGGSGATPTDGGCRLPSPAAGSQQQPSPAIKPQRQLLSQQQQQREWLLVKPLGVTSGVCTPTCLAVQLPVLGSHPRLPNFCSATN